MPRAVKRAYDSTRRQAMAEATRAHVIDCSERLFIEQGYEATSMRQLADAADVSVQTLYNAFGSKFGLFSALISVIVAGDHEPVAIADRPEMHAIADLTDPQRLLEGIVDTALPILVRLGPIHPTLRAAAATDPQVAEAYQRGTLDARYSDYRRFGERLAEIGALRPDVDADRAVDVLWTLLSPDVYDLLVGHRGWTPDEVREWATATLASTLLAERRGG